mgnify:CR=1 FL=1
MGAKRTCAVVSFHTTNDAMAIADAAKHVNLEGRLAPIPRQISAGCGLAWKAQPSEKELVCEAFTAGGIHWKEAYVLEV